VSQLFLLGREEPSFDGSFADLERTELSAGAWVEYTRHFVRGHATLCEALKSGLPWEQTTQHLYDQEVVTPRLVASIADVERDWPIVASMARALSERCGVVFDRISAAYYRGKDDSVAWHRDRNLRNKESGFVATVSVGEPRPFFLRPYGGGRSIRFQLGFGDLLIMGGTCQRTWEHTVPKLKQAIGPRISVMFRT
jgi:alkylated DNA repair dioxygenase AlkB